MGKKSIRDCRDFGLEFYVYLKETGRSGISERHLLDGIYNDEFRNGRHGFSFGSVLYGLSCFEKLKVKHGTIVVFLKQINKLKWSQPSRADVADKNGIEIYSSDYQFKDGKISFEIDNNSEHTVPLYIENTGDEPVHFIDYAVLRGFANFSLEVEYNVHKKHPLDLPPKYIHKVEATYSTSEVGVESAMLAFEFKLKRSSTSFYIVRFIEAKCKTTPGRNALSRHFAPPTWTPPPKVTIIEGQLPESLPEKKQTNLVPLYDYKLPKDMNRLILALKKPDTYWDQRQNTLEAPLSNNYEEKLHLLLNLEEYQMERDIKRYNIPNDDQQEVMMERDPFNKALLILKITAENRPTLMKGDQLLAYPVGETKKKYQCYVHSVQLDSVKLGFNRELLDIFIKGMKFHIEFIINRLTLRIQHRAADFAVRNGLAPVLFPIAPPHLLHNRLFLISSGLFDRKLEKNPEQYRAVQHIVAGSSKPAPYLVFGPPGTGKTVTMVEAIKQIVQCQPQSCILVCASTNKTADHLCQSLLMDLESKVIRIYAKNYSPQAVPDNLKACSNMARNHFELPKDIKALKSVNITTLLTSSRFVTYSFPEGHFTHVFVDEAEQAEEPKCILPLAGLLHPETGQVVLVGDPKQLGPIVKSPFARRFGMGVSLLERLMTDFPLYQKTNGVFDNRFVTKLLRNYRSHPAILKIPNELFYDGELQAYADDQCNSCCLFGSLPQKGFPIIFHEVTSYSSLFNTAEVDVLMGYVKNLLQTQGKNGLSTISPQEIGIIAPYRKQVQKICVSLEKVEKDYKIKDMSSLKVGTLEEFQGQERRVILVSTVCTSLQNDKWFNVAVNRAKALLIIVGNPTVSNSVSAWARFISYCKEKGGYK